MVFDIHFDIRASSGNSFAIDFRFSFVSALLALCLVSPGSLSSSRPLPRPHPGHEAGIVLQVDGEGRGVPPGVVLRAGAARWAEVHEMSD